MPGLETLTTDAQLKAQAAQSHLTRLLEERRQYQDKLVAAQQELTLIQSVLERIDAQLAEVTPHGA